ncbi:SurA N-terminal domain-containing protein [Pelagicoccus sp. SDUM812003]|uniref:peptidylprolyl isomerase n=1 Tax=Pelagicoccus sp. SDUM812003 TaxID=3041267 RepID=UPI00280E06EB|nr:SurA N-terminal domain-containing protein [Pelagicoccus sp. SDUM812003]MDQ8204386.1 peptidyl-prolyl cis-trans isomerase [Pelagicoccus sp. SDUM812003]
MISWLQINAQKHFRIVFIVLLVVLVVAFVFTIGNQGPMGGSRDSRLAELRFFDTELNTEAKRQAFQTDANLSATLSGNMRPSANLPFERATALHIANEHNIPGPTDKQLEAFLKSRPIFQGRNGAFDPQAYTMIVDNLKLGGRATEADLRRILEEDYRIEKVYSVLSGAGFAQESEVLNALSQRLAKWDVMVAKLDLNAYQPEIEVTEEQIKEHYEQYSFTYQTPVRRSVDYVEIDASRFVDGVQPTEDELITYFEDNYDRYQPAPAEPAEGEEEAAQPEPVTFEEARLAVRQDYRMEKARELALERAHDLVLDIIDNELSLGSEGFDLVIDELDLEMKNTPPFAENETPIGTTWGRDIVEQAFDLTPDRYYSEPILNGNRAIVIFYKDEIASVTPKLETIRERVASDVQREALRKARADYAVELQQTLEAAATGEEAFGAAAEEAGLEVTSYTDFSLSEPAEDMDRRLLSTLVDMEESEVSDFVRLGQNNQGAYVYVLEKEVPEIDRSDEQYEQVASSLNNAYARMSAQQYIQTLMTAEQIRAGFARPEAN